jgi:hypothetical protein
MKFYAYIKETIKKSFPLKFSIFLKVMEFRLDDFKLFSSTLWYENVDNYDFFNSENFLSFLDLLG